MDNQDLHAALEQAIAATAYAIETLAGIRETLPPLSTSSTYTVMPGVSVFTEDYTPDRYQQADATFARLHDELHEVEDLVASGDIAAEEAQARTADLETMIERVSDFMTRCKAHLSNGGAA